MIEQSGMQKTYGLGKNFCATNEGTRQRLMFVSSKSQLTSPHDAVLLRAYPLQDVAALPQMYLRNVCLSSATLLAAVIISNIDPLGLFVTSFPHLGPGFPLLLFPATVPCKDVR